MIQTVIHDLRYGTRMLRKNLGVTLLAVITLGLGIGANTAIFSLVNAVLLRSLPFPQAERIVAINKPAWDVGLPGIAAYEYLAWQEQNQSFEQVAAYSNGNFNLTGQVDPERISCALVTANTFPLLGVQPARGRVFRPDEDRPGHDQVAVVSAGFWQRRYGGQDSLIGSSIVLNEKSFTVIGVMPANFRFPGDYEVWLPLALDAEKERQGNTFSLVEVIARLKPGVSIEQAQADMSLIARRVVAPGEEKLPPSNLEVLPLHRQLVAGFRLPVLLLFGAVGLVLLIACVNVASLMLSRIASRQREMAVRAAVGAARWRLIQQLLIESLLLGLAGGVLGIGLAFWGIGPLVALIPADFVSSMQSLNDVGIDYRVLGFTLVISVLTGVIFGLAPALTASRPNLVKVLKEGGGHNGGGFGWRSPRHLLVITELALAMVLLLGAGLMVRSFKRLQSVNPGFSADQVLTVRIDLPRSRYREPARGAELYRQLLERVTAMPGTQAAGLINHRPLADYGQVAAFNFEGHAPFNRNQDTPIPVGVVSPNYFKALSIPLIAGRTFDDHDTVEGPRVALINQATARRFYPNEDPVGKRISFGCKEGLCRTIVGVVGNIKQEKLTAEATPEIYVPYLQLPVAGMTLFVRSTSDPLTLVGPLRDQMRQLDKDQPLYHIRTLNQRLSESMAQPRSLMWLFSGFAVLALALTMVGIYGVISFSVAQRTHEIGIRMALGAERRNVLRLIIGQGLRLVGMGLVLGALAAFALTRLMVKLLYGVSATDPITFVAVGLLLAGVALLASYIPARRATKVDPLVALRYE